MTKVWPWHVACITRAVTLRLRPILALALVACLGLGGACEARSEAVHRQRLREALEHEARGEFEAAVVALNAALAHRPDYPRLYWRLACVQARLGHEAEARAALESLAALGVSLDPKSDRVLGALVERPAFAPVTRRLAANAEPRGECVRDATATRTTVDGIIESLAWIAERGEWLLGDVQGRALLRVRPGATSPETISSLPAHLGGIFAIRCAPDGRTLWATSSHGEQGDTPKEGRRPGVTGLVAFDLVGKTPPKVFALPEDGEAHLLGDFARAEDGVFYVSDSLAPCLWRLDPGADALVPWIRSEEFVSLQGIVLSPDGRSLFVADYGSGIWKIDRSSRNVTPVPAPAATTLFGIDGLYRHGDDLIAVQNGIQPARILRLSLDRSGQLDRVTVIASGLKEFEDLGLGEVRGGRFWVVGDSGWSNLGEKHGSYRRPLSLLSMALPER